ncbi:hypothetical protein AB0I81_36485 [Nonomuraea sp. NPDC050404]|uniref:hypothetical protein n=1 Tax=Nonomuraea sp. NPDC050404 TaxID=3155783 RepID=UPI00340EEB7D
MASRTRSWCGVVLASALALTACSSGGDGEGGGGNTLRVLVLKHALTGPMKDMAWVAELEKKANVKITWEEVSADWDQKKSAMLAAGDVPDLVVGTNAITNSDLATFGTAFEDLKDDLGKLPNVKALFDAKPELRAMATRTGGEIYTVPGYKRFWPQTVTHQYINKKWLDELGLKTPTTWDELYDVLVAFKEKDANGNGDPDDEIPMDWSPVDTGGFGYFQPSVLLGSLGLPISAGGGQGYFVEDGKVRNFFVDDRYKRVIEFLHKCFAAGLISKDVMTQDYTGYQSVGRGQGDVAKVGFSWGWTASDRFGAQLAGQYRATAPLLAEAGQSTPTTWTYDSYGENFPANQIAMSASTGNKDAALRVINAFYDQDISIQVLFGQFGRNITKAGDKEYKVLPPADGKSDPSSWKWTTTLADNGPTWIRDDIEVTLPTDLQEAVDQSEPLLPSIKNMDLKRDVFPAQFIQMSAEDLTTLSTSNQTMLSITQPKFAQWITKGGVAGEWDAYVRQVNGSGMPANVATLQRYYDKYAAQRS